MQGVHVGVSVPPQVPLRNSSLSQSPMAVQLAHTPSDVSEHGTEAVVVVVLVVVAGTLGRGCRNAKNPKGEIPMGRGKGGEGSDEPKRGREGTKAKRNMQLQHIHTHTHTTEILPRGAGERAIGANTIAGWSWGRRLLNGGGEEIQLKDEGRRKKEEGRRKKEEGV